MRRLIGAAMLMAITLTAGRAAAAAATADWTQMHPANIPPARIQSAMAQLGDKLVMFGGLDFDNSVALGDTWIWDGANWTQIRQFGAFGNLGAPTPRFAASMAFDPDTGDVVMFGGRDAAGHFLNETWVLSFNFIEVLHRSFFEWSRQSTPTSPPGRAQATMEFDPNTRAVLMSTGVNAAQNFQDTWAFTPSPATWTQNGAAPLAPFRSQSAMAQCGVRFSCSVTNGRLSCPLVAGPSQILLFGGSNGGILGDTWDFENGAWTGPIATQTQPSARFAHGMAYHPGSGLTILYGGQGNSIQSDTWAAQCFDPSLHGTPTWAQLTPAHNPGLRAFHGMATGPSGNTVVVFGGLKLSGGSLAQSNETWVYGN
jgi:hypothetical protein